MNNSLVCPSCGSENCQSFSILNAHGTSEINTKTRTGGIGISRGGLGVGAAKSRTTGTQQTAVGAMTTPPAKKRLKWQVIFTALFVIFGFSSMSHGPGIIFLLIGLAFAYWGYSKIRFNKNVWPGLYDEWTRKFLCNKCGFVFEHIQNAVHSAQPEVAPTVE